MTNDKTHWGKLYGSLCLHPKWLSTPAEGRALWTSALSYCIVIGSDGDVPEGVLPMLTPPGTDVATGVEQLLSNGLWVRNDKGYSFHDWEAHQRTVEERKAIRAKRSAAGKASAEARRSPKSDEDGNTGSTSAGTPAEQTPNTCSTEKRREEKRREVTTSSVDEDFNRFWDIYPRKVAKKAARKKWDTAVKTSDPEQIIQGATRYAKKCEADRTEKQYIKQPDGWLNAGRWEDEIELTTITRAFNPWDKENYAA